MGRSAWVIVQLLLVASGALTGVVSTLEAPAGGLGGPFPTALVWLVFPRSPFSGSSSDHRAFRIRCTVTDGEVLPGMVLSVSLNSSVSAEARLAAVLPDADQVVLTVRCEDERDSPSCGTA